VFFRFFYPGLVVAGLLAAALIWLSTGEDKPSCELVSDSPHLVVQCGGTLVIDGKLVQLP